MTKLTFQFTENIGYQSLIENMIKEFKLTPTNFQIKEEGSRNQSRPLIFTPDRPLLGTPIKSDGDAQSIAETLTDLTLIVNNKPIYISLKFGSTLTFFNPGVKKIFTEEDIKSMAKNAIVFALANPDPEIDPVIARRHAAVVATGRSDQPNQINNVLVFPGFFRGLLDANISKITDEMLVLAAEAISSCVSDEQLNANFIVPSVFDLNVVQKVAAAVKKSSKE